MRRRWMWLLVGVLLLAGLGALAQQIIQSGKPIPGHAGRWITNLTMGDAGPAGGGPAGTGLTELNITSTLNNGLPFCVNDNPTTGPYHQLCLGADSAGGGMISYNAFGGAAPLPLQCNVNGTITACGAPTSAPAGGGITTPENFGAPHNGIGDDGPAFNAMFASAASTGWSKFGLVCNTTPYVIRTGVSSANTFVWEGCGAPSAPSADGYPIKVYGAITGFTFSGAGSIIRSLYLTGDRTPGQVGMSISGSRMKIIDTDIELMDTCILQPPGAGFLIEYRSVAGRNCQYAFMNMQDGVGPIISNAFYDTDFSKTSTGGHPNYDGYPLPTGGGIIISTEGTVIEQPNLIHGGAHGCIWLRPQSTHTNGVIWTKIEGGYSCDSNFGGPGILIDNETAGAVPLWGVLLSNTWSNTNQTGIIAQTDGTSTVDTIQITGGQIQNNLQDGFLVTSNSNVGRIVLNGVLVGGNKAVYTPYNGYTPGAGTYANLSFLQNSSFGNGLIRLVGNNIGRFMSFNGVPNWNLQLGAFGIEVDLVGNFFDSGGATGNINFGAVGSQTISMIAGNTNTLLPAPTLSGCGTGATVAGSDLSGVLTIGTGGSTACTVTWALKWQSPFGPSISPLQCTALSSVASLPPYISAQSATSVTFSFSGTIAASSLINYQCKIIGS